MPFHEVIHEVLYLLHSLDGLWVVHGYSNGRCLLNIDRQRVRFDVKPAMFKLCLVEKLLDKLSNNMRVRISHESVIHRKGFEEGVHNLTVLPLARLDCEDHLHA